MDGQEQYRWDSTEERYERVDDRTPEEKMRQAALFRAVYDAERRRLNPTPTRQYLDLLAWAASELRALLASGSGFVCELDQYAWLYARLMKQDGHRPPIDRAERLRQVSRNIWHAASEVERAACARGVSA